MQENNLLASDTIPFGYRVCYLANHFTAGIYRQIAVDLDIKRFPFTVLFCLNAVEPLAAPQICRMSGQSRRNIDAAIVEMLARRFIARRADPADPRRAVLGLTAQGRTVVEAAMPYLIEQERRMLEPLAPAERKTLGRLLAKLTLREDGWDLQADAGT